MKGPLMRRFLALVLLFALVFQSSAPAAATGAPNVNAAPPLSAVIRAEIDELLATFASTRVGALLTGTESRYAAMHDAPPDFSSLSHRSKLDPAVLRAVHVPMNVHQVVGSPITLPGMYSRPPSLDVLRAAGRNASNSSIRLRAATLTPTQLARPPLVRASVAGTAVAGGKRASSVNTSVPPITGVEPWHEYAQGGIPGAGDWMVNVASGNLIVEGTDFDIPERGIDLAFRRVYDSASGHDYVPTDGATTGLYGGGWTNNYDAHLGYDPVRNVISYYDIDDAREDFTWNGTTWVAPAGVHTQLLYDAGCGFWALKPSGTMYHFYSPTLSSSVVPSCSLGPSYNGYLGRLVTIYARNWNNNIQLTYYWTGDASDARNIAQILVQHSDGHSLWMHFNDVNAFHVLTSIDLPGGKHVNYGYDGDGELTDVCTPGNGVVDNSPGANAICGDTAHRHHRYGWNGGANIHQMAWADSPNFTMNWPASWNSVVEGYVNFRYDSSNRVSAADAVGVVNFTPSDGTGIALQPTTQTNPLYRETGFAYAAGVTTVTDTDSHAAKYTFDSLGRVTQRQAWLGGSNYLTSTSTWDGQNNVIESTDARGYATDYAYDQWGNTIAVALPYVTTSAGRFRPTSLYSYDVEHDGLGNPFTYNNVTAYCDPALTHTLGSDWATSPPATSDSLCPNIAGATQYQYNYGGSSGNEPFGQLTMATSPTGYHTRFYYDPSGPSGDAGLPTSVVSDGFTQVDGTNLTPSQAFQYDGHGNLTAYTKLANTVVTSGAGRNAWVLTYDTTTNRQQTVSDPDGIGMQPDTHASYSYYNDDGSLSKTETPYQHSLGQGPTFAYDADGNVTKSFAYVGGQWTSSGPTASSQVETDKYYDGDDRLVEVAQPSNPSDVYQSPAGAAKSSWITRYIYDMSQSDWYGTTAVNGTTVTVHGELFKTQEYQPSNTGTLSANYSLTVAPTKQTDTQFYDIKGNSFDLLDRVTEKYYYTYTGSSPHETLVKDVDTYDDPTAIGLLHSHCNALTQCSTMAYNELGQTTGITFNDSVTPARSLVYDPDGRAVQVNSATYGTQTYTYDAAGAVLTSTEPSTGANGWRGDTLTYHYYPNGARKALDLAYATLNQASLFAYSYNAEGKTQQQQINLPGNPLVGNTALGFTYTAGGRLVGRTEIGAAANGTAIQLNYNTFGQLAQKIYPGGTYSNIEYDASGEFLGEKAGTILNKFYYTTRGEVAGTSSTLHSTRTGSVYANGVALTSGSPAAATPTTGTWEPKMGVMLGSTTNDPTSETSSETAFSFDGVGRVIGESFDSLDDLHGTEQHAAVTRSYDAENHLLAQAGTSVAGYNWGPNGHPYQIGSGTSPTAISYDSLHWDGDQLLFTTNAAGDIDDIKIGAIGDITPLDSNYTGLTFYDRDSGSAIGFCHNATGTGGLGASDPYMSNTKFGAFRISPCSPVHGSFLMPVSLAWWGDSLSNGPASNIGRGGLLGMPRTDGIADGLNTIQGARTYDSQLGGWTTPDAYPGIIVAPATQKNYLWNGNNPVMYRDASGFAATLGNSPYGCTTVLCSNDSTSLAFDSASENFLDDPAVSCNKDHMCTRPNAAAWQAAEECVPLAGQVEYASNIYEDNTTHLYGHTAPYTDANETSVTFHPDAIPKNSTIIGQFHVHPPGVGAGMGDLDLHMRGADNFYHTAGGKMVNQSLLLWTYQDNTMYLQGWSNTMDPILRKLLRPPNTGINQLP